MRIYAEATMQACLLMGAYVYMHRAQALSEMEQSGIELAWREQLSCIGRKPAARRSEAESSWHGGNFDIRGTY